MGTFRQIASYPLRVGYIESTASMGGAEHALMAILSHLPRAFVEPILICPEPGQLTEYAAKHGLATLILPLPAFASTSSVIAGRKILNPLNSIYDLAAIGESARRLRTTLIENRIQLVHTNTMFAHFYGGLAARGAGIPSVWHVHDLIETTRFGGGAGFIFRLGARLADYLIAVSNAVKEAFSFLAGETVYIGIDLDEIKHKQQVPLDFILEAELIPIVSYVGRIAYSKGTDIFVKAASEVVQEIPQVRFFIAGEASANEAQYRQDIVSLIHNLGLANHVFLTGYQKSIMSLMEKSDVIVLPSRRESFGRVLIEAGALAKPVIASNVGGIPEIVMHKQTGLLVPPEKPEHLAAAIKHMLKHRESAKQMGINARSLVQSKFRIEQTSTRILEIYRDLLGI